jgi:hypothetical protein
MVRGFFEICVTIMQAWTDHLDDLPELGKLVAIIAARIV